MMMMIMFHAEGRDLVNYDRSIITVNIGMCFYYGQMNCVPPFCKSCHVTWPFSGKKHKMYIAV